MKQDYAKNSKTKSVRNSDLFNLKYTTHYYLILLIVLHFDNAQAQCNPDFNACLDPNQNFTVVCATANNGTPPFYYYWTPGGQTTACISYSGGYVTVTITDATGNTVLTDAPCHIWYHDNDGDLYYSEVCTSATAPSSTGWITSTGNTGNGPLDCNDNDPLINSGMDEICDGVDNDCDGVIDVGCIDLDSDGYTTGTGDCDDGDAAVNPGAGEICDGIDNDCDGVIDNGCIDLDGDGYFSSQGDCDDGNAAINPGAPEIIDYIDNNCNGVADEVTGASASGISPTSAQLSWSSNIGAVGYNLHYKKSTAATWTSVKYSSSTLSTTISGLKKNTEYQWKVRCKISGNGNNAIYGPFSNIMTFTTASARVYDEHINDTWHTERVHFFPNPVSDILNVKLMLSKAGNLKATVTDVAGREILSFSEYAVKGTWEREISLYGVSPGVYLLRLEVDDVLLGNERIIKR